MATQVIITKMTQSGTTESVQIEFVVQGILPNIVEIFANPISETGLGPLKATVIMKPPENTYSTIIQLQAGCVFNINSCPRAVDTNGVLGNYFDGKYWDSCCISQQFTTKAPPAPRTNTSDQQTPTPSIGLIEPHQATLHNEGNIVVHWIATHNYRQYHFMWMEGSQGWASTEINSGPSPSGSFRVAPTFPGREYSFKVQGCNPVDFGHNPCSAFTPPTKIVMPQNTHSLREFLRLSNVQLNPGIRSLGPTAYSSGIRAMMRL